MTETETLTFTDAAARKVGDLIRGEGNPNLKLRVFIQGGGCMPQKMIALSARA